MDRVGLMIAGTDLGDRSPTGQLSHCRQVSVELEEVVGSGDQPPFGSACREAAPLEAVGAAGHFGLSEDRLDHLLSTAVEGSAVFAADHALHLRIEAVDALVAQTSTVCRACGTRATIGVDDHLAAVDHEPLDLRHVPLAGIGEHGRWGLVDADRRELAARGAHHRLQQPPVRGVHRELGGDDDLRL